MRANKDSKISKTYSAIRNVLREVADDTSALQSLLSNLEDQGGAWLHKAYGELRRHLVHGRLSEAEDIGSLIEQVLNAREQGLQDELAENHIHRDSMKWLTDGIEAIFAQDNLTGINHLENLTEAIYCNESLQWVAWYWLSKAVFDEGNLKRAQEAANKALNLSEKLDLQAKGMSLCLLSEVEFHLGESDAALKYLSDAKAAFAEVGDQRGIAMASLTLARIYVRLDREDAALQAARDATNADPSWEAPVVFLSKRALAHAQFERANYVLNSFREGDQRSSEIERQFQLIHAVQQHQVPQEVIADILHIVERPPSEDSASTLERYWKQFPDFLQLREALAWALVKLGQEKLAEEHFKAMVYLNLDSELQSSVLLGLGCLANRRFRHRQPAARVKAASSSFNVIKSQKLEIVEDQEVQDDPNIEVIEAISQEETKAAIKGSAEDKEHNKHQPHHMALDFPFESDETLQAESLEIDEVLDASFEFSIEQVGDTGQSIQVMAEPPGEIEEQALSQEEIIEAEPLSPSQTLEADPSAIPAVEPKAVFTGDLQLFAVPDLLDFLLSSRRTGTLLITSENGIGAIYLHQGWITGAASPTSYNMGDLLIEMEAISEEQLKHAVEQQHEKSPNRLIGGILVEMELVKRNVVEQALVKQVKSALLEMVEWTQGRFAFEPDKRGEENPAQDVEIKLETRSILLDVLREIDERNR